MLFPCSLFRARLICGCLTPEGSQGQLVPWFWRVTWFPQHILYPILISPLCRVWEQIWGPHAYQFCPQPSAASCVLAEVGPGDM